MSRWGRTVAVLGLLGLMGCSSTAQRGAPYQIGSGISEVAAPETLRSIDGAVESRAKRSSVTAANVGVSKTSASRAEEAFVALVAGSPSPPRIAGSEARFGPGVTNRVIRIGATVRGPTDEVMKTLYPETVRPDFERVWEVLVDAVNSTGGIMGRRLEVVILPGDSTEEQACAKFTEEEDVIAVATELVDSAPCFEDAGVVTIAHAYATPRSFFRGAPHALAPVGMGLHRANDLYIDGLHQQGFFEGDHRIGLIRWDTPLFTTLSEEVIKPALASHGLELTEEVAIKDPETLDAGSVAEAQAEGKSAVQTFKRAGVDRVLALDSGSYILPEFTDYAEAQDYHPRYGVNSLVGGEWDMERNQLKGAMGIGWMPWLDLEPPHAYREGSEGARRCKDLMDAAGEARQMDTYNEAIWTSSICDAVLLLKSAVEAGGPSITADSIVAGAERLGTAFQASNTLLTRFGPGRHEGAAAVRFVRWFTGCGCFRYTSELLDAG